MKDFVASLEYGSTAVYVTVVSPMGKESPGLWLEDSVTKSELSLAVGASQDTMAVSEPGSVDCSIFGGVPDMIGFSVSII